MSDAERRGVRAVLIPAATNQPIREVRLPAVAQAQLLQLQQLVGGYIEMVPYRLPNEQTRALVVNEVGKMQGLPRNERASALMRKHLRREDHIVGDAVLVGENPVNGALTDCTLRGSELTVGFAVVELMADASGEAA